MELEVFKEKLKSKPESIAFSDTMQVIEDHFEFTPTAFTNGAIHNESGQNSGSCKVFAFAQMEDLSKESALACFGQYYTDVKNTPDAADHQNIRNFMNTGFAALSFDGIALQKK